jgi:hypothetical protein
LIVPREEVESSEEDGVPVWDAREPGVILWGGGRGRPASDRLLETSEGHAVVAR